MEHSALYETAKNALSGHRGILASDESPKSADKNLIKAGIEPSPEMRRRYRDLFINTPDLEKYINAIILHDETFWQNDFAGNSFRETLLEKGIEIVIKVDGGLTDLPESPGEKMTLGLDGLKERLAKYYEAGARLAKWRSVISIGEDLPTDAAIEANAVGLAEYSLFCQQNGIVPMVEPEVLLDGDHTIEQAEEVTTKVLKAVFAKLEEFNVDLEGVILKSSMVLPGSDSSQQATPQEIAEATVRTLRATVPEAVPGVVFLSGGQDPEEATLNFNEIAKLEPLPWQLTFSYLRAVEGPAGKVWGGVDANLEAARDAFIKRLELNVKADAGDYSEDLE